MKHHRIILKTDLNGETDRFIDIYNDMSTDEIKGFVSGVVQVCESLLTAEKGDTWTHSDMAEIVYKYLSVAQDESATCQKYVSVYGYHELTYDVDLGYFPTVQQFPYCPEEQEVILKMENDTHA